MRMRCREGLGCEGGREGGREGHRERGMALQWGCAVCL